MIDSHFEKEKIVTVHYICNDTLLLYNYFE